MSTFGLEALYCEHICKYQGVQVEARDNANTIVAQKSYPLALILFRRIQPVFPQVFIRGVRRGGICSL